MSVEISSTRREVKIPPLNVDPLAGKSGSKGVAENKNADLRLPYRTLYYYYISNLLCIQMSLHIIM